MFPGIEAEQVQLMPKLVKRFGHVKHGYGTAIMRGERDPVA
jgi:hypothetical protein